MHKLSDDLALFDIDSLSLKMEASNKGEEGGIRYLSLLDCEEKPYKLRVDAKTNTLYRSIDRKKYKPHKLPNGLFLYIVSPRGELYLIKEPAEIDIFQRHSSLREGREVLCAGKMRVKEGKIISMDNASGHYKPDTRHLHLVVIYLYQQGILTRDCAINEKYSVSYGKKGRIRISLTLENLLKISPYLHEYEELTHFSIK